MVYLSIKNSFYISSLLFESAQPGKFVHIYHANVHRYCICLVYTSAT